MHREGVCVSQRTETGACDSSLTNASFVNVTIVLLVGGMVKCIS